MCDMDINMCPAIRLRNAPKPLYNTTAEIQSKNCVSLTTMLYSNKKVQVIEKNNHLWSFSYKINIVHFWDPSLNHVVQKPSSNKQHYKRGLCEPLIIFYSNLILMLPKTVGNISISLRDTKQWAEVSNC